MLEPFRSDSPCHFVIVTGTHDDLDYSDPRHSASLNLAIILETMEHHGARMGVRPVGPAVEALCNLVLSDDVGCRLEHRSHSLRLGGQSS